MARRKAKRRGTRRHADRPADAPAGEDDTGLDALGRRARAALEAGRHKDAIAACKALLKAQPDGPWRDALARAYAGRAAELAAKGMLVEALAIHEQRAAACGTPLVTARYLTWMLLAGRVELALALLREHVDALEQVGELAALRESLAAFALVDGGELVARLRAGDPDAADRDPVVRDHAVAGELIDAFCAADGSRFDAALKRIAFRSPYRGLRQLLAAWRQRRTDPRGAEAALARIDPDSPFRPLADVLTRAGTLVRAVDEGSAAALIDADAPAVALAGIEAGWPDALTALLADARALGPAPDAKARLQLVLDHAATLGKASARAAALQLLIDYPQGRRSVTKRLGELAPLERARLDALLAERERKDLFEIELAWEAVLDALLPHGLRDPIDEGGRTTDEDRDVRLRAALVHRRLADLWGHGPSWDTDEDPVRIHLGASLALDPDDAPSAVRLVAAAREARDLKAARAALADALERFPDDVAVLLEAVRTALASEAFKKAAGLAARLLRIDPVNVPVRALLLEAHLAHARKQFQAGKMELARRQLDEAGSWTRTPVAAGRVDVLRGLVEIAAGERADGALRVRRGFDALGGALAGRFAVNLECVRLGRHVATVAKLARLPALSGVGEPRHALDLVRAIGAAAQERGRTLDLALAPLAGTLRAAAAHDFALEEDELICETLARASQYALLETFAVRAAKRWPERPAFVYHRTLGENRGEDFEVDGAQERRLEKALESAREQGDARLVHRIERLLMPPLFGFPFPGGGPGSGPGGGPRGSPFPELDGPPGLAELIELLGPRFIEDMEAAEASGETPDAFFDRLRDELLGDEPELDAGSPGGSAGGGKRGKRRGARGR